MRKTHTCPSCGGGIKQLNSLVCEYCGAKLEEQDFKTSSSIHIDKEILAEALQTVEGDVKKEPKKRGFLKPALIVLLVLFGVFFFLFNRGDSLLEEGLDTVREIASHVEDRVGNTVSRELSIDEARELMREYLAEKYPHLAMLEASMRVRSHEGVIFTTTISGGDFEFRAMLHSWQDEEGHQVMIFDQYQAEIITNSLEELVFNEIGLSEGESFLTTETRYSPLSTDILPTLPFFNTYFNGDLEEFFQSEASIRQEMFNALIEGGAANRNSLMNVNGIFVIYLQDPYVLTFTERILNQSTSHIGSFDQAFSEIAKRFQIQVRAIFFPQDYYELLRDRIERDRSGSVSYRMLREAAKRITYYGEAPLPIPYMTGWYMSEGVQGGSSSFFVEGKAFGSGVFLLGSYSDYYWIVFEAIELEAPQEVMDVVAGEGVTVTGSRSIAVRGTSSYGFLVLDRVALGIPDVDYMVVATRPHLDEARLRNQFMSTLREIHHHFWGAQTALFNDYMIVHLGRMREEERIISIIY